MLSSIDTDFVIFSYHAFNFFDKYISADKLDYSIKPFMGLGKPETTSYAIPFNSFLGAKQYLIRIEPPTDLLLYLSDHPDFLYKISPRKFEEVIADLFEDFGYEIELTKQTRDNGIDIIAINRIYEPVGPERYLLQCKRHSPKHKVGLSVVHDLLGVGVEEPNTGLVLVTTSYFTKPARSLLKKEIVKWKLHLRDYDDIRAWLNAYAQKRLR